MAAAGTAFTWNSGFPSPVGSGDAGNDKFAFVLPAQAATDLSGDPYPSVHITDFGIADGPFKPNRDSLGKDTFVRNGSGTQSSVFGRTRDHNVFPGPVTDMCVGCIPKARNSINTIWRTMVTRLNLAPKIFAICGGRRSGIRIGSSSSTSALAQNTLPPWLPTMPTSIHGPRYTSHGAVCRLGRIQTSLVCGQRYSSATQICVSGQAGTGVVSEDLARLLEFILEH